MVGILSDINAMMMLIGCQSLWHPKDRVDFGMFFSIEERRRISAAALPRVRSRYTTASPPAPWI